MSETAVKIEGLEAGTWAIDTAHSDISFTVRHLMVSKVRGSFTSFEGNLRIGENPLESSVEVTIDLGSVDTRDANRDAHLRSADFFGVDVNPTATFRSTGVHARGDGYVVDGELSIHGVTRPVSLDLEFNGTTSDSRMGTRAGFSASTELSRSDFGIDISMPLDGGGVVIGDKIKVQLEVEAILQAA
jgi:polyisoprenoid-binding protein YceI